ncbi:MAG: hypothetical protein Q9209_006949 [Squamulea sp. 1 TL-2023]
MADCCMNQVIGTATEILHRDLDSASVSSSILDYEFENGRRYHAYKAGSYPLPNDEQELERIDIKHHVTILLAGGNLHLAPLNNPKRILDIGTGTGIWAIEMAEQYPHSQELDCRFTSDDNTLLETHNLTRWSHLIIEAAVKYNRPIPRYTDYLGWFEKAGFTNIRQVVFKSPTNPWPKNKLLKEAGKFQLLAHIEGLEGVSLGLLTRGLDWTAEEVKVLIAKCRPELKDRSIHSYQTNVFITGRKPENPRHGNNYSSHHSNISAPLTPTSFSSSNAHSPNEQGSPAAAEELNAFTPVVPVVSHVA